MASIPRRLHDYLVELRDHFVYEAKSRAAYVIDHVFVVLRDDLDIKAAYGPSGRLIHQDDSGTFFAGGRHHRRRIIGFDTLTTFIEPKWTELGRRAAAGGSIPSAYGLTEEARKHFVSEPGFVAMSYLVTLELDEHTQHRRDRITALVDDAAILMDKLSQAVTLDLWPPLRPFTEERHSLTRWFVFVHRLAWAVRNNAESLLRAVRHSWTVGKHAAIIPYEEDALRTLKTHFLHDAEFAIPADRYFSELSHDAATASAYAIDELLELLKGVAPITHSSPSPHPDLALASKPQRSTIFISYAHKDEQWLEQILTMMGPHAKNALPIWHDKQIRPGEQWREEIDDALQRACIGVLLVTKHFLDSTFINEVELAYLVEQAEKNALEILWVPVGHCLWKNSPIAKFQSVVDPANPLEKCRGASRDKLTVNICEKIIAAARNRGLSDVE